MRRWLVRWSRCHSSWPDWPYRLVQDPAGAVDGADPAAVGVVAVGLRAAAAQAVAVVEAVQDAVLVGQVALQVVAQADHAGATAAAGLDVGQAVGGVVAVVLVARLRSARHLHVGQVVQHVVGVAGGTEHRRRRAGEPVQGVVGHVAVAAVAGDRIADGRDVADGVVVVAVVVDGRRAVHVVAAVGQAAGVLGQRMDDAVAVGELPLTQLPLVQAASYRSIKSPLTELAPRFCYRTSAEIFRNRSKWSD